MPAAHIRVSKLCCKFNISCLRTVNSLRIRLFTPPPPPPKGQFSDVNAPEPGPRRSSTVRLPTPAKQESRFASQISFPRMDTETRRNNKDYRCVLSIYEIPRQSLSKTHRTETDGISSASSILFQVHALLHALLTLTFQKSRILPTDCTCSTRFTEQTPTFILNSIYRLAFVIQKVPCL